MQQSKVQLVTFIGSEEPFDWGLQLENIAVPLCIFCPEDLYETLIAKPSSAFVEIRISSVVENPGSFQKLHFMSEVADEKEQQTAQFYWLEISFLQAHLSFAFLNSNVLSDWLLTVADPLVLFEFPDMENGVLWGGSAAELCALTAHCRVLNDLLFSPVVDPGKIASEINQRFRKLHFKDHEPNLEIAGVIQEPVLHLVADEFIFYSFTPLPETGCRRHVLVQPQGNDFFEGFSYRFFHHLSALSFQHSGSIIETGFLQKLQIKAGDLVIFGAGSVDLEGEEIENTEGNIEKYVAQIAVLSETLNFRAGLAEIPPAAAFSEFTPEENGRDSGEKTHITQYFNALIRKWAEAYDIPVFSFYHKLANEAGILAPEKSDGYKYISQDFSRDLLDDFENNMKKYSKNAILKEEKTYICSNLL